MRTLLIALFALLTLATAACSALPNDPAVQYDPGFAAYAGCGMNGKFHDAKENFAVRENGKIKFLRICKEPYASL